MARHELGPVAGWAVGQTIHAYRKLRSSGPTGAPVDTAVVAADGSTTFTALELATRYVATNGSTSVDFTLADDDAGGPSVCFSSTVAAVGVSASFRVRKATSIVRVRLACASAPDGSDLVVAVRVNGASIETLTISDGETTEAAEAPGVLVDTGDLLSVQATSVGSGTPAGGVVVQVDLAAS